MKAIFSFLTATLCALSTLFAQAPAIQWQNTIGGNGREEFTTLQQTSDGGYILGGWSLSSTSGDKTENNIGEADFWMVKLNATGAIQWQNTIGGNSNDYLTSLQQTSDGGYILGGYSDSNISGDKTENRIGGHDYWVVKLGATGTIEWQNTIGGNSNDYLTSLQQTSDGGYILGGYSDSNISGDKTENSLGLDDYWVIKLDDAGVIEWQNTIGGDSNDHLTSLQQTSDGGYILGGYSASNISGDKTENSWGGLDGDYWVVKLNATGNIQWQNTIGGDLDDYLTSFQQTADGGYILGGYSQSNISGDKTENSLGLFDYWAVKLNASGTLQWQNTIGGNSYEELRSIKQTTDEGYVLGGLSHSNISGDKTENSFGFGDYWVVKLNTTGAIQWQNTIGGTSAEGIFDLQQTADGGYILGGHSFSDISGDKTENSNGYSDYWVIKLSPETVPTTAVPTMLPGVTIYPNPTTDAVFVQTDKETTLCLRNAIGQSLLTQTLHSNGKIDLSPFPNGIYFLMEMETGIGHKIVKKK